MSAPSSPELSARVVRYADLRPCTTAFVDSRTPGSERKENFTIIGPGVAENPEQYVHISIPHGFNIGGARQPPHCVNSQHSHETAEVFVVHSGRWRFKTGHDGNGPSVDLGEGDTISIPIHVFRGFENIGNETGFMFAVLGGDDPGHVTWAPYVFEAAARHGLVLLESGRLIDTARENLPAGARVQRPTTEADLVRYRTVSREELENTVVRADALRAGGELSVVQGFEECPVVGAANPSESMPAGRIAWPHGFQLRALRAKPNARTKSYVRYEEEVLLVHRGHPRVGVVGSELELGPGDTFTVPKGVPRWIDSGPEPTTIYVVRGGDQPSAPSWR
jgi:mannose-6-phosphate isomerase-like protein (cupin superfamily)